MPYWYNRTLGKIQTVIAPRGLRISEASGRLSHREDYCHTTSLKKPGRTFAARPGVVPRLCVSADTRHGDCRK